MGPFGTFWTGLCVGVDQSLDYPFIYLLAPPARVQNLTETLVTTLAIAPTDRLCGSRSSPALCQGSSRLGTSQLSLHGMVTGTSTVQQILSLMHRGANSLSNSSRTTSPRQPSRRPFLNLRAQVSAWQCTTLMSLSRALHEHLSAMQENAASHVSLERRTQCEIYATRRPLCNCT